MLRCSGVEVFRCSGVCLGLRVDDIWESQRGDRGGGPKMATIFYGVKFQPQKCF